MSNSTDDRSGRAGTREEPREPAHLADVEDGFGCVEVWEHLSDRRSSD